eukprot:5062895-Karenia_brevis.AAC.1
MAHDCLWEALLPNQLCCCSCCMTTPRAKIRCEAAQYLKCHASPLGPNPCAGHKVVESLVARLIDDGTMDAIRLVG